MHTSSVVRLNVTVEVLIGSDDASSYETNLALTLPPLRWFRSIHRPKMPAPSSAPQGLRL
jgi:hypothetical protein